MKVIKLITNEDVVNSTLDLIWEYWEDDKIFVLGTATGKTMEPLYQSFVERCQGEKKDVSSLRLVVLDDYLGLAPGDPRLFCATIKRSLMLPLEMNEDQMLCPTLSSDYQKTIEAWGGIDVQLLGLGLNGHIGFNEPGSKIEDKIRVVNLSETTREQNKKIFTENENPIQGITLGIAEILSSRKILLLVTGEHKSEIVKKIFHHINDPLLPASYLHSHQHCYCLLDQGASQKLDSKI